MSAREETASQQEPSTASLTEIYREQFRHIRHLDWEGYVVFILTVAIALGVIVLDGIGVLGWEDITHALIVHVLLLALAIGAGHHLVELTTGTWRRYAVLTQVENALGLYEAGVVPPAYRFFPPAEFRKFAWRFLVSRRGPLFVIYLLVAIYVALELRHELLPADIAFHTPLALLLAIVPSFLTLLLNYRALRHVLMSLRRQQEANVAAPCDMADRFVAVGESLMLLSPPRVEDALRQFRRALVSDPGHADAQQWITRLERQPTIGYRFP